MQKRLIVFILLFASFGLVYSSIAYYLQSRLPSEEFISWGVFSPTGNLSGYFSGPGANVTVGEILSWHFAITNNMGSIQFVRMVYRLANSTYLSPNSTVPADGVPEIGNSSIFVAKSQTGVLNFTWGIVSKTVSSGLVFLRMMINGRQVSSQVGADAGQRFRFFFELWTYDTQSHEFLYGYKGQTSRVGEPLQIWFNVE